MFCLTTSSLSARCSAASYSSRVAAFRRTTSMQLFNRCFLFHCFIRRRSHPRVEFFDLASRHFQFGFAGAVSTLLQLFDSFFKLSIE